MPATWARRANLLVRELEAGGHALLHLDFLVTEAVTVVGRRAKDAAVLGAALARVRHWNASGEISFVDRPDLSFDDALGVVLDTHGSLSFNDALLVVLQRDDVIGEVVSFDSGFDAMRGFRRIH